MTRAARRSFHSTAARRARRLCTVQDILNVHFHKAHREQLRVLSCRYNWRNPCGCPEPVAVYHGNIDQRHREPDSEFAKHFATFAVINRELEAHFAAGAAA